MPVQLTTTRQGGGKVAAGLASQDPVQRAHDYVHDLAVIDPQVARIIETAFMVEAATSLARSRRRCGQVL